MERIIEKLLEMELMLPAKRHIRQLESLGRGDEAQQKLEAWQAMLDANPILVEKKGYVGIITFNTPENDNEIKPIMRGLFHAATRELDNDEDIRVILVTGRGKTFSIGAYPDPPPVGFSGGLHFGHKGTWPEGARWAFRRMSQRTTSSMYGIEKPTIAAINGPVFAEANDIALAADIRIGHKKSDFTFSFCWLGNSAYTGSAWLLPRIVGIGRASDYLLTARPISGEEAYRSGLLNYLVQEETLMEESLALAHKMAELPPVAARMIKIQLQRSLAQLDLDMGLEFASVIEPICQATEDHISAEAAATAKKKVIGNKVIGKVNIGEMMSQKRVAKGK